MKIIVFTIFCIGVAVAMPYDIIEDGDGNQYYALPITRTRRLVSHLLLLFKYILLLLQAVKSFKN